MLQFNNPAHFIAHLMGVFFLCSGLGLSVFKPAQALTGNPGFRVYPPAPQSNGSRSSFVPDQETCPTVTQFYPIASEPGKTITISGTNFVPGTLVFFGGLHLIPAASVPVDSATQIRVGVPPTLNGTDNVNSLWKASPVACLPASTGCIRFETCEVQFLTGFPDEKWSNQACFLH